jgi:hypothetical protein
VQVAGEASPEAVRIALDAGGQPQRSEHFVNAFLVDTPDSPSGMIVG